MVTGRITSALSNKKYDFEFEPLKSLLKKNLIIAEVNRLYFDYYPPMGKKKGPSGECGIILCYTSED